MLEIEECTANEIQNHPGSRNQYLSEAQALPSGLYALRAGSGAGGQDQSILPQVLVATT
jgi:hypothetical protein